MSYPVPPPPSGYPSAPQAQPVQHPQYQAVQFQPGQFQQPHNQAQQPVASDKLPGWDRIMSGGAKVLSTRDMEVGRWYGGLVITVDPPQQATNAETKLPEFFPDGNPRVQYPLSFVDANLVGQNGPDDQGIRRLFIKSHLIGQVKAALAAHQCQSPEQGGTLYVMLTVKGGPGESTRAHQWQAQYTPSTPESVAMAKQLAAGPSTAQPPAEAPQYPPQAQNPGPPPAPVTDGNLHPDVAPPPPPQPPAPEMPEAYAGAGWTVQQYAAKIAAENLAPPPVAPQPGAPSPWPYGQAQQPGAPVTPPPGVPAPPAPPAGPNWG